MEMHAMEQRYAAVAESTDKVEAVNGLHRPECDPGPGKHRWIVAAAWVVNVESYGSSGVLDLDAANLLRLSPPMCEKCGVAFTPQADAYPCPGRPDDEDAAS